LMNWQQGRGLRRPGHCLLIDKGLSYEKDKREGLDPVRSQSQRCISTISRKNGL
jgi:hypothetical protein